MDVDHIRKLIHRIRNGQATEAEKIEFEQFCSWAQSDQTLFNALTAEERETIRKEMYNRIQLRIATIEGKTQRQRFMFPMVVKLAASLSAIAIVAFAFYWVETTNRDYVTVSSPFGEHTHVVLPDGSEVTLNGNSYIRYHDSWTAQDDREVWIEGEGFFDVQHTKNHQKFIVHTVERMDVQVLGTRFNVKVRRGKAEVMLEEGRVRLNRDNASSDAVTLQPGELATLQAGVLVKQRVDPSLYASWKDYKLHFYETPLSEVADILEDTYGFKVYFENPALADRKLSGRIQSKNVNEVLTAIEESLGIEMDVNGRSLRIHGRNNIEK